MRSRPGGYSEWRETSPIALAPAGQEGSAGLFRVWKSCEWRFGHDPGKFND
jgi:hypothetical protein